MVLESFTMNKAEVCDRDEKRPKKSFMYNNPYLCILETSVPELVHYLQVLNKQLNTYSYISGFSVDIEINYNL